LQALNLLNDPVFLEAAQALAQRVSSAADLPRQVQLAFRLALSREPSAGELARLERYYAQQKALAAADPKALPPLTGVCSVLLNLDEFIVRE
ncbi:MAG: DUF1553 domain-containing protein, partial [Acidobacteria bacterium]|nr:DUF1553 domain-containing protein [Acidobacteriota bacterium]